MTADEHVDNRRWIRQPKGEDDNIQVAPEFESEMPPYLRAELADLHRSIDREGCREALLVWRGQNVLLDGHHRLPYCREKGYPFAVLERDFPDREAAKAYVAEAQLGKRNLSPVAESYLRGKRYVAAKRQGARTDLTSGQSDQKSAAEQLAESFQVGEKTIRRDGKLYEAVDRIVANCGGAARNVLLSKDQAWTRGGILRLAKLDAAAQQSFLQQWQDVGEKPPARASNPRPGHMTLPTQVPALVQAILKRFERREVVKLAKALVAALPSRARSSKQKSKTKRTSAKT